MDPVDYGCLNFDVISLQSILFYYLDFYFYFLFFLRRAFNSDVESHAN